jgi:hypothetical protein
MFLQIEQIMLLPSLVLYIATRFDLFKTSVLNKTIPMFIRAHFAPFDENMYICPIFHEKPKQHLLGQHLDIITWSNCFELF